ncbi:hypothetical protein IID10_17730, partial [candidate division KSB1 bacterium]|nr:hypothetical protein [candidate division KSB1 bacterium]
METLPSLHLFCKKSFQNVHYHDLDYLKGSKQLQISPQDVSLKSNILNENTKVSFPQLNMFYDYLSKSEQTEKCRVILFNSPAKNTESANGIIDFAKILAQHGNRILVLDCDFRTGISQSFFDLQPGMGVTDYVSGMKKLIRVLSDDPFEDDSGTSKSLSHAIQLATDYYAFIEHRYDRSFHSIKAWNPTGFDDYVIWEFGRRRDDGTYSAQTRVNSTPYNLEVETVLPLCDF